MIYFKILINIRLADLLNFLLSYFLECNLLNVSFIDNLDNQTISY